MAPPAGIYAAKPPSLRSVGNMAALPKLRPQRGPAVDSSTLRIVRLGWHGKAQAPPQAWSRIEGSVWIPGHNPRSHIGHLILTLALRPRSGTKKGAPFPFLPLAFAGVWVVANLVLGKAHYPDIITKIYSK